MVKKTLSVEDIVKAKQTLDKGEREDDLVEVLALILKEIESLRVDIKNLKLNMMQMQQLKVAMGTRV